ncbi:DUF4197 domain-containing protein [Hufsiella ginkgonis]|uniref:DUF4197 family protein n=1 Tax=Hufsiella ginkgonis TaxID=2695274 RepID=A0A7K1XUP4_9SPHI|nr:DUF4197 domain-containing protein [Hufsiella ginkgonis]MXV14704.1 DUF4197 family protein [Hufsiella ginkgonis]
MKIIIRTTSLVCILLFASCETLNQAAGVLSQAGINPSATEIALGLKQALEVGTGNGSDRLSAKDGFLGNLAVKILFPPEAQKVEKTLRSVGLGSLADNVITSLNRAAEDAATEAKPIFVSAIKQMTINDAVNILLGNQNDAATQYFKRVTSAQLAAKFNPIITNSLGKVGATKYWSTAMTSYNKIPLVTKINPDLDDYVTQKAIDGLFYEIAGEELKIRTNISARSTTLLQRVFGYADQNKAKQ